MSNQYTNTQTPPLGVAVLIMHQNRVLLGRRLKAPMLHSWQLPGGWVHYAESPEQAAHRIIHEFEGIHYDTLQFQTLTDNHFEEGLHSVSLYYQTQCMNPEHLELRNNQHCSDWSWVDWYDLPHPLFLPLQLLTQSGYAPFLSKV